MVPTASEDIAMNIPTFRIASPVRRFIALALAVWPSACRRTPRSTWSPANPNGRRSPKEIGGDRVNVSSATTATQDPHRIEARPSLIARMRNADLVVCTGLDLEVGWLPMLIQQSGNARLASGLAGLLRGRSVRHAARGAGSARSQRRRRPCAGQSAHPARPAQHREGCDRAGRAPRANRCAERRRVPARAAGVSGPLERRASRNGSSRPCR